MVVMQKCFKDMEIDLEDKVGRSIALLQLWEKKAKQLDPDEGYWGCDSGGKDSGCIRALASMAEVQVKWHHNVTTIDPPEIYRFIRKHHPETIWHYQPQNFFTVLAEKRGYPTRMNRWCCREFKERSGSGKVTILGVRWAESPRRKKIWKSFQQFDPSRNHGKSLDVSFAVNPLIEWTDDDVWNFTWSQNIPYCELYDQGYKRLGCVGCPNRGPNGVAIDFKRWPHYARAWKQAFRKLWKKRRGSTMTKGKHIGKPWPGFDNIKTADELFEAWVKGIGNQKKEDDECQLGLW